MIMMPHSWPSHLAAAHRPGRLLAPHRLASLARCRDGDVRFGSSFGQFLPPSPAGRVTRDGSGTDGPRRQQPGVQHLHEELS
jgi:hypothetical protein